MGSAVTFLKKHPFIKKKGLFFYLQNVPFMDLAFFFALSDNYISFFLCSPGQAVISLPQKTLVLNCLKRLTYDPGCSSITYLHQHKTDSRNALLVATLVCLKYKKMIALLTKSRCRQLSILSQLLLATSNVPFWLLRQVDYFILVGISS